MKLSFNAQFLDVLSSINPQRQTSILKLNKEFDTFQSVSWYDLQGNVKIHCNNDSIFVDAIQNIPEYDSFASVWIKLNRLSRFIKFTNPDDSVRKIQRALYLATESSPSSSYSKSEINEQLRGLSNDLVEISYLEGYEKLRPQSPMFNQNFRMALFQIVEALVQIK